MATDFRVVTPTDMGSSIKLGVKEPNKYDVDLTQLDLPAGLTGLSLQGTVLTATTSDSPVTVDLAPMLPTVTAEVFLKSVTRDNNDLVFTVGEKGSTANDTTLRVSVADLLPVVADNITVQGTGVTADPLKVKLSTTTADNVLKQAADGLYVSLADLPQPTLSESREVRLVNATGETVIGYLYTTEQ